MSTQNNITGARVDGAADPADSTGPPRDCGGPTSSSTGPPRDNELVLQLTVQLAEAINLQDRDLIAQLHETIRCVRQFDNHEFVLFTYSNYLRYLVNNLC